MKHAYLPILIALGLILCGAKHAQSQSPRPSIQSKTHLSDKRETRSSETETRAIPESSQRIAQPSEPSVQAEENQNGSNVIEGHAKTEKSKEPDYSWIWSLIQTILQLVFTLATTVATVYLAVFTYRLVTVTDQMKQATADAANASKDSASAAKTSAEAAQSQLELAKVAGEQSIKIAQQSVEIAKQNAEISAHGLLAERPILLLETITLHNFLEPQMELPTTGGPVLRELFAVLEVRNRGRGPAVIQSFYIRMQLVDSFSITFPNRFNSDEEMQISQPVIGGLEAQKFYPPARGYFVMADFDRTEVMANRKKIYLLGELIYTDAAGVNTFTLQFSACYSPPDTRLPEGNWFRFPKEYNRH